MRVKIEGDSTPARSIRSYLEKHGAAVTDGVADLAVVVEQSFSSHVELDTIPCPLQAALLKHLSRSIRSSIIVHMEKTGQVTADDRIIVRIPSDPTIEQDVEIAVFRGIAEFLGRAEQQQAMQPPKLPRDPWHKSVIRRWKAPSATAAVLLVVALIFVLAFSGHAETDEQQPKPISIEDREAVKDLQIKAQDAVIREKQAQIDLEHAQHDLDTFNAQIRAMTEVLVKRYAPSGDWQITPAFSWAKKGKP